MAPPALNRIKGKQMCECESVSRRIIDAANLKIRLVVHSPHYQSPDAAEAINAYFNHFDFAHSFMSLQRIIITVAMQFFNSSIAMLPNDDTVIYQHGCPPVHWSICPTMIWYAISNLRMPPPCAPGINQSIKGDLLMRLECFFLDKISSLSAPLKTRCHR